ncbi:MAG: undecaprenyldiphospho-muramoylpentapeptide beta-N-acetylglucosaminyltransferase [Bacteroidales bacterium]|nr:undecaprenyldiphospho-muramoylpentapeptide beta-N-acetylglucosaminyltransferase [Bacteroidales bacterium]
MSEMRVIISGGGTGGHIFPALAIADELRRLDKGTQFLFVGAEGRMEMERVPAAGYEIVGLPIAGLSRSLSLSNLALPFKLAKSLRLAGRVMRSFKPDIAIGVGGYASAPLLWEASRRGIPTLIQEQNGFAGLANRMLGRRVNRVCVAYEGMEKFFPADKIVFTGNPIRGGFAPATAEQRAEGIEYYGLDADCKHIFITGGSLGSRTLNAAVRSWIEAGCPGGGNVEVLWQCGKHYLAETEEFMKGASAKVHFADFISRMDLAYAAADVVVSRSGASTVSELCAAGKATVFVPSPNVTEDHQTHNAMALVNKDAALLVRDDEAVEKLMPTVLELLADDSRRKVLEKNILALARTDAASKIAEEVRELVGEK